MVGIDRGRVEACHVDGDTGVDVSKARCRSVGLALDGELAAGVGAEDADSLGDILGGLRDEDAGRGQVGLLQRPVRVLGRDVACITGVGELRGEGVDVGEERALRLGMGISRCV